MIIVDKENFETEVLQSELPCIVDLWGPKCTPCLELLPQVEALAPKYAGKIKFCKLNAAENRRLSMALKVMGLPTFLFYKAGGVLQESITGEAVSIDAITHHTNTLLEGEKNHE